MLVQRDTSEQGFTYLQVEDHPSRALYHDLKDGWLVVNLFLSTDVPEGKRVQIAKALLLAALAELDYGVSEMKES
jgi:hypothetical protein